MPLIFPQSFHWLIESSKKPSWLPIKKKAPLKIYPKQPHEKFDPPIVTYNSPIPIMPAFLGAGKEIA